MAEDDEVSALGYLDTMVEAELSSFLLFVKHIISDKFVSAAPWSRLSFLHL